MMLHNELRVMITHWKKSVLFLNEPETENIYAQSTCILHIPQKHQNYKSIPKLKTQQTTPIISHNNQAIELKPLTEENQKDKRK